LLNSASTAAFFARTHCSDILLGYRTVEEIQDMHGYEEEKQATVVTLEGKVDSN
jgi:hypothetical protein